MRVMQLLCIYDGDGRSVLHLLGIEFSCECGPDRLAIGIAYWHRSAGHMLSREMYW